MAIIHVLWPCKSGGLGAEAPWRGNLGEQLGPPTAGPAKNGRGFPHLPFPLCFSQRQRNIIIRTPAHPITVSGTLVHLHSHSGSSLHIPLATHKSSLGHSAVRLPGRCDSRGLEPGFGCIYAYHGEREHVSQTNCGVPCEYQTASSPRLGGS